MAKRTRNGLPVFAEPGLDVLQINMRGGLAQLVPSGHYGSPGFTAYGEPNRKDDGQNYLLVKLDIKLDRSRDEWHAVLGVHDGDDTCIQVWRPLTWVNWRFLTDMYHLLAPGIGQKTLDYLRLLEVAGKEVKNE